MVYFRTDISDDKFDQSRAKARILTRQKSQVVALLESNSADTMVWADRFMHAAIEFGKIELQM